MLLILSIFCSVHATEPPVKGAFALTFHFFSPGLLLGLDTADSKYGSPVQRQSRMLWWLAGSCHLLTAMYYPTMEASEFKMEVMIKGMKLTLWAMRVSAPHSLRLLTQ